MLASALDAESLMESFEKRKRERKKQQIRKEKAARKLQGTEPGAPSQEDYFADPSAQAELGEGEDDDLDALDSTNSPDPTIADLPPTKEGAGGAT